MLRRALEEAIAQALKEMGVPVRLKVARAPKDKPGDYGVPLFALAKELRKPPQAIAQELKDRLPLPEFVEEAVPVGGYLNFRLRTEALLREALRPKAPFPRRPGVVLVEHTSVNPNKELHVGHLRNIALCEAAAYFAFDVLEPEGTFVAKVLAGGAEGSLQQLLKQRFKKVVNVKPPSSRADSSEKFVVATGFRGEEASEDEDDDV